MEGFAQLFNLRIRASCSSGDAMIDYWHLDDGCGDPELDQINERHSVEIHQRVGLEDCIIHCDSLATSRSCSQKLSIQGGQCRTRGFAFNEIHLLFVFVKCHTSILPAPSTVDVQLFQLVECRRLVSWVFTRRHYASETKDESGLGIGVCSNSAFLNKIAQLHHHSGLVSMKCTNLNHHH